MRPKPLRSDAFPEGLPDLSGKDKVREEQANHLFQETVHLVTQLPDDVTWVIENPTSSYMWGSINDEPS